MGEWERVFIVRKRYTIEQEESEKLKVNQQITKPVTHKQLAPLEQQMIKNKIKFNGELKGGKK